MKLIKLDAIDSTNSFLKELVQKNSVEDFTIVVTKAQFAGKGQMGKTWETEHGKNLIFSVFKRFSDIEIYHQNYLNYAISIAIYTVLNALNLPKLSIKWPNDILSANKKLCGILIENSYQNDHIKHTFIGIGVNVNQTKFSKELVHATSLKNCLKKEVDLDELLKRLQKSLTINLSHFEEKSFDLLEKQYHNYLYKKDIPTAFKDQKENIFMGIVKGVSNNGKLQVLLENDKVQEFGIKEIRFL